MVFVKLPGHHNDVLRHRSIKQAHSAQTSSQKMRPMPRCRRLSPLEDPSLPFLVLHGPATYSQSLVHPPTNPLHPSANFRTHSSAPSHLLQHHSPLLSHSTKSTPTSLPTAVLLSSLLRLFYPTGFFQQLYRFLLYPNRRLHQSTNDLRNLVRSLRLTNQSGSYRIRTSR